MLTQREVKVLQLRKKGKTQADIAQQLDISQAAVSGFENNAKRKIRDAAQTLKQAKELGYDKDGEHN